jgi:cell fate (sporulation/competence/biofilm development) regulator YmcA (YheA/YmcA/DUF963 family)
MDSCSNAEGCGNACSWTPPQTQLVSAEVTQAAEALACLLTDVPEFQDFLRLARTVRLDGEVNEIVARMNGYAGEPEAEQNDEGALEESLEALPVVREYRQSEVATRAVFRAVEEAISKAAGVPFAEHARPKACG